jgi:hypothetical protein
MDTTAWMAQSPSRVVEILGEESWRAADAVAAVLLILACISASLMLLAFLAFVSPVLTGVVLLGVALIHIMGAAVGALPAP